MPLPSNGTCSYNGVTFTSLYRSSVSARPVQDEAERTTVYVEHTLSIEGYIAAQPTDVTLAEMRKKLTAQGGALTYNSKGYGDLTINTGVGTGSPSDAKWGPCPELLDWTPLADANAALVKWKVVVRIPECDSAIFKKGILALNYDVNYSIDQDGYTTIVTSGYLEIPMTRDSASSRSLPDTADAYWEKIAGEPPVGFQRVKNERKLSKDKRRLDWSLADQEVPAPLPKGCTRCDATQSLRSSIKQGGFKIWTLTLDVSVTLARGEARTNALDVFLLILRDRTGGAQVGGKNRKFLPQDMSISDQIFGRTTNFSITLLGMQSRDLGAILTESRMWQPVGGVSHPLWRASLAASANHPRGFARVQHQLTDDAILDLCAGTRPPVTPDPVASAKGPGKGVNKAGQNKPGGPGRRPGGGGGFFSSIEQEIEDFPDIEPEESWLRFRPKISMAQDPRINEHRPVLVHPLGPNIDGQGGIVRPKPAFDGGGNLGDAEEREGGPGGPRGFESAPLTTFDSCGAPATRIVFSGDAARAGYRIPLPGLTQVGGQPVIELFRYFEEYQEAALGGVPIFALAWYIEYGVARPPVGALPVPVNPAYGVDGDAGSAKDYLS